MAIPTPPFSPMPELYILRHGNTFDKGDVVRRVGARTDLPLSVSGEAQARDIGAHLAGSVGGFARIFAAPLKRTAMTAEIIRKKTNSACGVEPLAMLTEVDYGPDEGKPEEDVVARIGAGALEAWETSAEPPPGWLVDPAALVQGWRDFFDMLKGESGPILAVTSNGVARFALAAADHLRGEFPKKLRTAAYGRVVIDPNGSAHIKAWDVRA